MATGVALRLEYYSMFETSGTHCVAPASSRYVGGLEQIDFGSFTRVAATERAVWRREAQSTRTAAKLWQHRIPSRNHCKHLWTDRET